MRKNSTGRFVLDPPVDGEPWPPLGYEIEVLRPENTALTLSPALTVIRDDHERVYVREQDGVVALQFPIIRERRHFDLFVADLPRLINGRRWWTLMVNLRLFDLRGLTEENYARVLGPLLFPESNFFCPHLLGGGFNVNVEENSLDYDLEFLHPGKLPDFKVLNLFDGDGEGWELIEEIFWRMLGPIRWRILGECPALDLSDAVPLDMVQLTFPPADTEFSGSGVDDEIPF